MERYERSDDVSQDPCMYGNGFHIDRSGTLPDPMAKHRDAEKPYAGTNYTDPQTSSSIYGSGKNSPCESVRTDDGGRERIGRSNTSGTRCR